MCAGLYLKWRLQNKMLATVLCPYYLLKWFLDTLSLIIFPFPQSFLTWSLIGFSQHSLKQMQTVYNLVVLITECFAWAHIYCSMQLQEKRCKWKVNLLIYSMQLQEKRCKLKINSQNKLWSFPYVHNLVLLHTCSVDAHNVNVTGRVCYLT
jgi:hypothetical protein